MATITGWKEIDQRMNDTRKVIEESKRIRSSIHQSSQSSSIGRVKVKVTPIITGVRLRRYTDSD